VLIGCFVVNLPLGVTQRVQSGYQEAYISNLFTAAGSILALGAVILVVRMHAGLQWLVLGFAGVPVLALALNTAWFFGYHKPWLTPSLSTAKLVSATKLFRIGILFFVLQVALAVGFGSDSIVLARILGPVTVAQYSLTSRIFTILPMLLGFVVMPLWPAYGEAFARGDIRWLKQTLYRSLFLALLVAVLANSVLVFTSTAILRMWVGPQIAPSFALLVGLAISQTLMAITTPISVLLNGLKVLRVQAICFALMAIVNISASIYLTHRIGISGVVYGSIIAQLLCLILPASMLLPKFLSSLEHRPALSCTKATTFNGDAGAIQCAFQPEQAE
jgi:O-antigen/teichoic acid export membrane protein